MSPLTAADWRRKLVHAGMGLFALTLKYLTWPQAALCAAIALAFNLFVMPRIGRGIYRDGTRKIDVGIVSYAAMVLVLILMFGRYSLSIVAIVWSMMAFGDPAASLAGTMIGGRRLPWNSKKTWAGLVACFLVSTAAGMAMKWFFGAPTVFTIGLILAAAVFAILESVPAGIDDNLVAAIPTALAYIGFSLPYPPAWVFMHASPGRIARAVLVNLVVALVAWKLKVVRPSGALAGGIVGTCFVLYGGVQHLDGWSAYQILWLFFILGTLATKIGYSRKAARGVAEPNQGKRGAAHVLANCSVALFFLATVNPYLVWVSAFAAALADTFGTEFGTLFGRTAYSPLTFRRVPVGTPGAVSLPGTLASLVGSAAMAFGALALHPRALAGVVWIVVIAGFLGAFSESVLNSLGLRFGFRLNHHFANWMNTLIAAVLAGFLNYAIPWLLS